jgi:hypothetical protein
MCLDPRPDRPFRVVRPARRLSSRVPAFHGPVQSHARQSAVAPPIVRAPALWALDTLAGDDELVARGWVVLSREN